MSDGWRDRILSAFAPGAARLTLVADPDGLVREEATLQAIAERGFIVMHYDDPVAFRYEFETRFRDPWERGDPLALVVVTDREPRDLRALPHDLLAVGRTLAFDLITLFPGLSHTVVTALDRSDLDALDDAQRRERPGQLGEAATKDFVLRHVFKIAPELIIQPADLVRLLLERHHRGQRLPIILDERLIQLLRARPQFADWPLDQIVPDRLAFFAFVQERWPVFLDRLTAGATGQGVKESAAAYDLAYPGPALLPLDQPTVRVYLDNLFLEGQLQPVERGYPEALAGHWATIGVRRDPRAERRRHAEHLLIALADDLPLDDARHQRWAEFAYRWAHLVVLRHERGGLGVAELDRRWADLRERIDARFRGWVQARYGSLHNQPALPPVMLHHVPRALAHEHVTAGGRAALIVVDGLALDQWLVLREILLRQRPGPRLDEGAAFAWLPTLTTVSRQALFAGRPPLFFPGSLATTAREPALWQQFWTDLGLAPREISYLKSLGDPGDLPAVAELVEDPGRRVLGLVVDTVDRIMHGMELGTAGMHNQVRQWAEVGFLANLLDLLGRRGVATWLVADHGNIEAIGRGSPREGAIADLRGERARAYPTEDLRARARRLPGGAALAADRAAGRLSPAPRARSRGLRPEGPPDRWTWWDLHRGGGGAGHPGDVGRGVMRQRLIGFSQRVRLNWLEETAQLVIAGRSPVEIRAALQDLLSDHLSVGSSASGSNRDKAVSILLGIWASPPTALLPFRDDGLRLLGMLPERDCLSLHWGMSMAAYPFFGAVAEAVGRLLALQSAIAATEAQRRVREHHGERETVARAARRVLRCFVDWGVLNDVGQRGVYRAPAAEPVHDRRLTWWLVEAVLVMRGTTHAPVPSLMQSPALFPFHLHPMGSSASELTGRLEVFRQGLHEEMVMLRATSGNAGQRGELALL